MVALVVKLLLTEGQCCNRRAMASRRTEEGKMALPNACRYVSSKLSLMYLCLSLLSLSSSVV